MIKLLHEELKKNLIAFDKFCNENNIKYFLGYGSLIGALRHQGFVPWDDDIDICMDRDNYRKLELLIKDVPKPFCIKKAFMSGNDNFFMKWEDNSTTVIETWSEKAKWAHGLFIDIFPIDKFPTKKRKSLLKLYSFWNILLYVRFKRLSFHNFNFWLKLLIAPGYFSLKLFLNLMPNKWFAKLMDHRFSKWNKLQDNYRYGCLVDPLEFPKVSFSKKIIESKIILQTFEKQKFPILKNSMDFLINKYGDDVMDIPKNKIYQNQHFVLFKNDKSYLDYFNNKNEMLKLKKELKQNLSFKK